jgi:outer membrane protein OmpA-like peptidoglycan-associated protein
MIRKTLIIYAWMSIPILVGTLLMNGCGNTANNRTQDSNANETEQHEKPSANVEGVRKPKIFPELKPKKTPRGLVFTLNDGLFETAKAELLPGAVPNMESIVALLKQYPNRKVLIECHIDIRENEAYHLGLAQRRADSMRFTLIQRGIASNRILSRGVGKSRLSTKQNRQVEMTILNEGEILR